MTTVNILATLLTPTSGKATVAGYDVTKDGMKVRRLIGYLPEDLNEQLWRARGDLNP